MIKLFFSIFIVFSGLALGYTIQHLSSNGVVQLPCSIQYLRKILQKAGTLFFISIASIGAIWIIRIDNLAIITMPFIGIFVFILGGILAIGASKIIGSTRRQTGSLFSCGSFSNVGSLGSLIVFMFLGEKGFALVPMYRLFEMLYYFIIGFPITKYFSNKKDESEGILHQLKAILSDIFVLSSISAVFIGGMLNFLKIPRPEIFNAVLSVFIPLGIFILLVSIGLGIKFSGIKSYLTECLAVSAIKFLILPSFACTIGYLLGFHEIDDGLPLKVLLILASMPVAFTALIPPSIYELDVDLSNACWLSTTVSVFFLLPLLYLIIN